MTEATLTHIYSVLYAYLSLYSFPLWFPVLYRRTLWLIHPICNSSHPHSEALGDTPGEPHLHPLVTSTRRPTGFPHKIKLNHRTTVHASMLRAGSPCPEVFPWPYCKKTQPDQRCSSHRAETGREWRPRPTSG